MTLVLGPCRTCTDNTFIRTEIHHLNKVSSTVTYSSYTAEVTGFESPAGYNRPSDNSQPAAEVSTQCMPGISCTSGNGVRGIGDTAYVRFLVKVTENETLKTYG